MGLEELFESLTEEQQIFQFGVETDNPLAHAFPRKRVVHAGLNGTVVAPDESQAIWQEIMSKTPQEKGTQTAYIHIPFCKTKCLYCGFFQNGTDQAVEDQYIDALIKELEAAAVAPRMKDSLIHAVFIGGGTPTSLSPRNMARLLQAIQRCLPLANDYELTLEGRIHDVVPENMEVWFANGVNRVSLGVQSFHTEIRRNVGRLDDQETVLKHLENLCSYNQSANVIDLIYGLPGQDLDIWKEDLDLLMASGVDGCDLYQLNVFDGSDLNKAIQAGRLPAAATTEYQSAMFSFGKNYLAQHGYKRLNICHWSCTNRERSLYNTLARSAAPMFPFGSGAGGHVDGYSTMLHRIIQPYEAYVQMGKKPFMALMKQSPLEPIVEEVQAQFEMGAVNLQTIIAFDARLKDLQWVFDLWQKRGLLAFNGIQYELTEAGQFWQVNLTQSTLECIQFIMTGQNAIAVEKVAAQDSAKADAMVQAMKKMKEMYSGHGVEVMKKMAEMSGGHPSARKRGAMSGKKGAEAMKQMGNPMGDMADPMKKMAEAMNRMSPEELQAVMKRMMGDD